MSAFYTATNAAPRPERSAIIPEGQYRAAITNATLKDTKAGTGQYLEIEFTVLEGEQKGRKFWDRLNIINPNAEAQRIARESMDELCFVTGKLTLSSPADLIGSTVKRMS
jgi:hypothetical protein